MGVESGGAVVLYVMELVGWEEVVEVRGGRVQWSGGS